MSKRDHNLFLEDMLDAIEAISCYTNGLDIKRFIDDRKTVDAVIRNSEILGEAASQVPESFKDTGLTQNQNLRGHHADPFFTDAAIIQCSRLQLWQLYTDLLCRSLRALEP